MKKIAHIMLLLLAMTFSLQASASEKEGNGVDVKEIVLGHMADAYEWHITTIWGKSIAIPLLVMVKSEQTGEWLVCSSSVRQDL